MKRRLAFVQLAMVSMALRPADTAASEPPKKVRRVTKKELRYLLKRLVAVPRKHLAETT